MKTYKLCLLFIVIFSFSFIRSSERVIKNDSFQAGESYYYKIKFGFIPIGEANVKVDQKIFNIDGKNLYKINVFGRTTGLTDVFKIRNNYKSYVDTTSILPHSFYYSAREGNFRRNQELYFNHKANKVTFKDSEGTKKFNVPAGVQDVISGYYFLRTIDFSNYTIGQTITTPLFFDDEIYQLKVKYNGKETIKTSFGKIKVFKLNPILPNNKLFDGESGIRIWVSDDKNRVPVKIEVDFKVGSSTMELKNYKGNKHPFNWF